MNIIQSSFNNPRFCRIHGNFELLGPACMEQIAMSYESIEITLNFTPFLHCFQDNLQFQAPFEHNLQPMILLDHGT